MTKNFKNIRILFFVCLAVFLLPFATQAASIKVDFGPEFALNGQNMAPGDTIKGTFTVENLTNNTQNLAIKIKIQQGAWQSLVNNIEEKLYVKIKKPDGFFATMPNGTDEQVLSELENNPFTFYSLAGPAGNTAAFELWVTFDANAGNEYQDKKAVFDILAGIETAEQVNNDNGDNGNGNGNGNGRRRQRPPATTAGFFTAGAVGGATEEATGEITEGSQETPGEGEVRGEEAGEEKCLPISWWVFAIILGIYILIMLYNLFYKLKESENIRWFWEIFYTVMALVIWYFFDRCRTNIWFIYASIISGLILYLIYIYLSKKNKPEPAAN